MRRVVCAGFLVGLLAGCGQPRAGVAIDARPGGVAVTPSFSGSIGGLAVTVRG